MASRAKTLAKGEERQGNCGHKCVSLEDGMAREVSEEAASGVGAWACELSSSLVD